MFCRAALPPLLLLGLVGFAPARAAPETAAPATADVAAVPQRVVGGGERPAIPQTGAASTAQKQVWPRETGSATLYASDMEGLATASGESYDPEQLTAAHRSLPLGARVRVINVKNNKSILVRVNDRWGGGGDRIVNLSRRAAMELGFGSAGMIPVALEVESIIPGSVVPRSAPAVIRVRQLPQRLADDSSRQHCKQRLCQNESEILGLRGQHQRNHIATCMARK